MKLIRIYFKRTMPRQPRLEKIYVPTAQGSFLHSYDMLVFISLNQFMERLVKLKIVKFSEFFLKNITSIRVFWGRMTFIALHLTEHLVAMTYIDTILCVIYLKGLKFLL